MDNEVNTSWPFNLDYNREERLSEVVAKEQREILFQNWLRSKYKIEAIIQTQKERFLKVETIGL